MIQEHFSNIESENEAATLTSKLNSVINHMIYKEGIIIVESNDENDQNKTLVLNANYNNPESY